MNNFVADVKRAIEEKNQKVSTYLEKSKLGKISLFLWTSTPTDLRFHKMENNALINFPDDNEFNKLLLTYTLFKKVLSKVGKIDIKFDYLTLFFDTVQIEEEKKTKIIQKIAEKNIVDNSYKYDDCSISFFNNVIQQSDQELVSSERGVYSLLGNQTNNYSILVCLIPEKIESFVTKKIKDIEEEFTKKYEKYGSIDSWIIDELRLNKAFAHAFELSYKGKIAIPKQPTT